MKFSFEYLWKCILSGIIYIPVTLKLALIPLFIALILGTLIALARIFKVPVVEKFFKIFDSSLIQKTSEIHRIYADKYILTNL